ncbi:MAG: AzlC family ABC transporter permease [Chloroflexi bacterium AL-W]|nr:AzlC family ABC transporter permease [Chloroflexi bacterium AL-N1]NOK69849.1 AzlC family ABC transporter permease [Chloroflexi bacterium AL-N10]NOK73547.1 AzlC family ABC transporter permease [Chloroflexi bacterium AL-N5]NOK84019.1 AzlC family ABC transporter permease [Chloroflexi bacterium AL-W]NOK87878.1 AzlC family ABC transporter permease [Chloroflexi bacterium AL-N15]
MSHKSRLVSQSSPDQHLPTKPAHHPFFSKTDFRAGFVATLPLWLGAAPFGIIYAVTAIAAGLTPAQTLGMSLLVFAGAAQFTAAGMFGGGIAPCTIITTALILNTRHILLAASLVPFLRPVKLWGKALLAFQLTDETYAVGIQQFLEGKGSPGFQFGANISLYCIWQLSTVVGIFLGRFVPDPAAYGLDLVFPLTFMALLVPLLRDRTSVCVAVIAGGLTIVGILLLPGSWYILLAGIVASGLGAWFSRKQP